LDSLVYEMVRLSGSAGNLPVAEERACQFPISPDPATFDRFFTVHKVRNRITPQHLRDAIRWVQPFSWLEEAKALDVEKLAEAWVTTTQSVVLRLIHFWTRAEKLNPDWAESPSA
jgi:hypothetical protein